MTIAVTRDGAFDVGWFAPECVAGIKPPVPQNTNGLPRKRSIKHHSAIDVRDAALIGAILDATMHALEHALGMQQTRRQGFGVIAAGQSTARRY